MLFMSLSKTLSIIDNKKYTTNIYNKRWKREKKETWRKFLRKKNHRRHKKKFVRGRHFTKGQPLTTIPTLGNYSLATWKFWETNFKWLKPPRNHRNHPKEDARSGDILRKLNTDSVLVATWRQNLGGSSSWPVAITKDLNSRARDGERRRGLTGFNSHPRTSFIRRLKTTGMSASFHRDFPFFLWRQIRYVHFSHQYRVSFYSKVQFPEDSLANGSNFSQDFVYRSLRALLSSYRDILARVKNTWTRIQGIFVNRSWKLHDCFHDVIENWKSIREIS